MFSNTRLRELRQKHGLTQRALAEILRVTVPSMQRFEYGSAKPKLKNIIALADFFNVSLDYLTGRTDNPEINR